MKNKVKHGGAKANYVCFKHKYNAKHPGLCPICRNPLKCLGPRWRIGHMGQFDKKERKTRKLNGQQPIISWRTTLQKRREINQRIKLVRVPVIVKPL